MNLVQWVLQDRPDLVGNQALLVNKEVQELQARLGLRVQEGKPGPEVHQAQEARPVHRVKSASLALLEDLDQKVKLEHLDKMEHLVDKVLRDHKDHAVNQDLGGESGTPGLAGRSGASGRFMMHLEKQICVIHMHNANCGTIFII